MPEYHNFPGADCWCGPNVATDGPIVVVYHFDRVGRRLRKILGPHILQYYNPEVFDPIIPVVGNGGTFGNL